MLIGDEYVGPTGLEFCDEYEGGPTGALLGGE